MKGIFEVKLSFDLPLILPPNMDSNFNWKLFQKFQISQI